MVLAWSKGLARDFEPMLADLLILQWWGIR
jgi:hypothetical protein